MLMENAFSVLINRSVFEMAWFCLNWTVHTACADWYHHEGTSEDSAAAAALAFRHICDGKECLEKYKIDFPLEAIYKKLALGPMISHR
jgi:hypothetical protein